MLKGRSEELRRQNSFASYLFVLQVIQHISDSSVVLINTIDHITVGNLPEM